MNSPVQRDFWKIAGFAACVFGEFDKPLTFSPYFISNNSVKNIENEIFDGRMLLLPWLHFLQKWWKWRFCGKKLDILNSFLDIFDWSSLIIAWFFRQKWRIWRFWWRILNTLKVIFPTKTRKNKVLSENGLLRCARNDGEFRLWHTMMGHKKTPLRCRGGVQFCGGFDTGYALLNHRRPY